MPAKRKQHFAAQTAHGEIVRPLFDVAFEVGVGALQIMIGVMHQGCDAQQQRFGVDGVIGILAESAADVGEGGDAAGITGALVDLPAQERRAQVLGTPATHEFDVRQGCFTRAKLEIHTGARQPHAQCLGVMLYGRVIGVQRDLVGALFSQDLAFAKPRFGIVRCQAKGALDQVQRARHAPHAGTGLPKTWRAISPHQVAASLGQKPGAHVHRARQAD